MVGFDRPTPAPADAGSRSRRQGAAVLVVVAALSAGGFADVGHVVAPGENLLTIARRYATTPQAIAQANHLANPNLIVIGTQLRIPASPAPPALRAAPPPAPAANVPLPAPPAVTYMVKRGDNLTTIAVHYGVTPAALAALNGISKLSLIQVGRVLKIPAPSAASVEALLEKYAATFKVEAALIKALAWQESGWQQQVISDVGAVGVMQLMPETGRFTGDIILQRAVDTADLEHNVEAGVAFFAYLVRQAKGDVQLAVAGYYQGLRSVVQKGMQADTKRYVANVMALRQRFSS
ncbi:MAG TPA: LysM peptidoglycan-binding domain-containing protein [Actinomycetota bacterium]|nr:LysM peptidoglycan-binding domain-containing protein [Actinomycetota bacterium]